MRRETLLAPFLAAGLALACGDSTPGPGAGDAAALRDQARALARDQLILDGHIDVPMRLYRSRAEGGSLAQDISGRTESGNFDYERALEGGLDAAFMSIFVPARYEAEGGGKKLADELIDLVEGMVERFPDRFALARDPQEVRRNKAAGRMSLPMGMENGTPLEGELGNVAYFAERGIRYITLTHSRDNPLGDSSFDDAHTHAGLSEFGRQVVAEMNRVGIMIDVSHVSDDTFWDVLETSETPVIASHSSCRHFTPGWERNMSDEMIRALASRGGVIQINFGSYFVDDDVRLARERRRADLRNLLEARGLEGASPEARDTIVEFYAAHPLPAVTAERVADHLEHVIELAGIDHVGLGSDFDGVGDALPADLADVSQFPNLILALLERGYTPEEIEQISSGNALRVWQAVEDFARSVRESGA